MPVSTKKNLASMLLGASCLILGSTATAQADCAALPSWSSHSAVPAPNNAEPMSNCAFHQWAWNMFLWMTQDAGDGTLRFQKFASFDQVFDQSVAKTAFAALKQPALLPLKPRSAKGGPSSDLSEINQAGSRGILVHESKAQPGAGRVVYYSINVTPDFYNFVRDNGYQNPETYFKAPAEQNFPVGAAEFKYSWRVLEDGDDTSGMFTIDAEIEQLVEGPDGTIVTDPTKTDKARVALVGMHVVGVVENHPEFIWATFEHNKNAPNIPTSGLPAPDQPVSDQNWTFYKANTPVNKSNLPNNGQLKLADASAQLFTPPNNVFRRFPWGGGNSENVSNIQSLNASVRATTLKDAPIWGNYFLVGATWGPSSATQPLVPNQVVTGLGSIQLSNSTIETFTQESANCFTCHSTFGSIKDGHQLPGKNMNISHAMTMGYFRNLKK